MSSSSSQQTLKMPELPPEIITYILVRLHVKPLLRFRSVSKPWCSQIDSPEFIKLHLHHHSTPTTLVLPHPQLLTIQSLSLDSLGRFVSFQDPPATENHLIGSCNGLLCTYKSVTEIFFWNPLTRNHLKLPLMPIASSREFDPYSFDFADMAYGFGYDSLHDDYKLVTLDRSCNTCVFSMKLNLWKRTLGVPFAFCPNQSVGVFASGALHWMIIRSMSVGVGEGKRRSLIVAIDLGSAQYYPRFLTPPLQEENMAFGFRVLNGLLAVSFHHIEGNLNVWVMKEYGVESSWTKLLSIDVQSLMRPLAYSNSGNEVIMGGCCRNLYSYDLEKKTMESLQVQVCEWLNAFEEEPIFGDSMFEAQVFVGSLVKPVTVLWLEETVVLYGNRGSRETIRRERRGMDSCPKDSSWSYKQ